MNSESDLDEEEEILIYADFTDAADDNLFNIENLQVLNILGINEKRPIIQVNNCFFEGTYQRSLGTHLFFSEAEPVKSDDPVFEPTPEAALEFVCKTRKILQLSRAYLEKRSANESEETNSAPIVDVKVESFSNEQEAVEVIVKELHLKSDDKHAERERLRRIQRERKMSKNPNISPRTCEDSDSKEKGPSRIESFDEDSMDLDEQSDANYVLEDILDTKNVQKPSVEMKKEIA